MLSFPQPVDFAVWRQDAPIRRIEWRNKLVRPGAEAEKLAVSAIVRRIVSVRSPCWNCLFILQPTTLRIAVGPSGSDDQKLIQALKQSFAREGSSVRLELITTAGPVESIALLGASKTDLAIARGDEEMPDSTESVAILRRNVVVLWPASGLSRHGSKKEARPKIKGIDHLAGHRVGVVGRTPVNVTLLRVILVESGVILKK
jgi:TRAP-type uncharacterized transport system substrate-binding protein